MDAESAILKLVETCKQPSELLHQLEDFPVPFSDKAYFYFELGLILFNHGYFDFSLVCFNAALEFSLKTHDREAELNCRINLGILYRSLGDFSKALQYHEQSLEIAKAIHIESKEGKCYCDIGVIFFCMGQFSKAQIYYQKSLEVAQRIGDRFEESACYNEFGTLYRTLGDINRSIFFFEKALKLIPNDLSARSRVLTNLGNLYESVCDYRHAIDTHLESLDISKKLGNKSGESKCYLNLGNAHRALKQFDQAIFFLKKCEALTKSTGDISVTLDYCSNLGLVYAERDCFNQAIEYYEKALPIAQKIGRKWEESIIYANMGYAFYKLNNGVLSEEYNQKALALSVDMSDIQLQILVYYQLGLLYSCDNPDKAYVYFEKSIILSELISHQLMDETLKVTFNDRSADVYNKIIPLCLALSRENKAFEFAERGRARALNALLSTGKIFPTKKPTTSNRLFSEEELCLEKIRAIHKQSRENKSIIDPNEIEKIFDTLNTIHDEIEKFDPDYAFTRRALPLSLNNVRLMLSKFDRRAVLVEYFQNNDETLIFVINNTGLHVESVPLSVEKIMIPLIDNFVDTVLNYLNNKQTNYRWLEFSDYLIKPIRKYIENDDLIYFIPFGLLHYLPLHALELDNKPIIENHAVAYAPSASILNNCRFKGTGNLNTCVSFGNTFESEAEKIAALFKVTANVGTAASKIKFKESVNNDIIHVSSHGKFFFNDPLSSGIKLHDGVLTAREIYDLRLNSELVTLSACETGVSKLSHGEELMGLTRALLYAGAPSVIASLWRVDPKASEELMCQFYDHLLNGLNKATALQMAQKALYQKYHEPYYWAPFILTGNYENRIYK